MEYLAHYGVKGQKWGVRRYQNLDGTLTDEGRRHYGYGSQREKLMTQNTKERIKEGFRAGRTAGAVIGGIKGGTAAGVALAMLPPGSQAVAAAGMLFATHVLSATAGGAIGGTLAGAIIGKVETSKGRAWIEKNDKGLAEFESRDNPKYFKKKYGFDSYEDMR